MEDCSSNSVSVANLFFFFVFQTAFVWMQHKKICLKTVLNQKYIQQKIRLTYCNFDNNSSNSFMMLLAIIKYWNTSIISIVLLEECAER